MYHPIIIIIKAHFWLKKGSERSFLHRLGLSERSPWTVNTMESAVAAIKIKSLPC